MSVTFMDRRAVPSPTENPSTPRLVQINQKKTPVMTAGGDFNPMTLPKNDICTSTSVPTPCCNKSLSDR